MKFTEGKNTAFYTGLQEAINLYFQRTGYSKYGNSTIWIKLFLLLSLYLASYAGIYLFQEQKWLALLSAILLGLTGVMIVFNIVHDASHHAISKHRSINQALCLLGDWVGINTYIWNIRHNIQHHTFTNILGGDLIIENIPLIRLTPATPHRGFHRFQVGYAPFLYAGYALYWIAIIDIKLFFRKKICNLRNLSHSHWEWAKLIFFKSLYIFQIIICPILFTDFSWQEVLLGFMIMHAVSGILLSFVAVLGHFVPQTSFPIPNAQAQINSSWSEHQLHATIDFAPHSRIINWITGGLNTHVAHHLFPHICHCHYRAITPIIEDYCRQYGYRYQKESIVNAVQSHFKYLYHLGKA